MPNFGKKLNVTEKCKILQHLSEPGASQSSVARAVGVSRKTVQNIIANREALTTISLENVNLNRCHLKPRGNFADVDETLHDWFVTMRNAHGEVPLLEDIICQKARKIAQNLDIKDFKASRGWFRGWKERYGLKLYTVSQ